MSSLDLGLLCLISWGGVAGYLSGWKKSFYKLAALFAAIKLAGCFKQDMRSVIVASFPLEQFVKEVIGSRLAVPVDASVSAIQRLIIELQLPPVLQEVIMYRFIETTSANQAVRLFQILTEMSLNLFAFVLLLILWGGGIQLYIAVASLKKSEAVSVTGRWAGFIIGVAYRFVLVAMLIGIVLPMLWLANVPEWPVDPGRSLLVRWSMLLFNRWGVW